MRSKKLYRYIKLVMLTGSVMGTAYNTAALALENEHVMGREAVGSEARIMHLAGSHDLTFGGGITMVAQSLRGDAAAADEQSGITYSVDIAFEGDFGDKGSALVYINTAQGTAVDPMAGAGGVNADDESGLTVNGGYSATRIAEAWYKMPVGEKVQITVGKIDPTGIYDGNKVANDQTTQFLGDVFVNNAAIEFPGYAAGINISADINDSVSVNIGAFEPTDDFTGNQNLKFSIAELGLATNMMGQPANLRLTGWQRSDNNNKGLAISADQAINDDLTVFARYGTQEATQAFDSAVSVGGQWAMQHDMLGFAYSRVSATGTGDDESQLEIYYSYAVADHVHITADLQRISHPGFDGSLDDVTVVGLRLQADM